MYGFSHKNIRSPATSAPSPAERVGAESEEIPAIVEFSAKPETERWREFLSWYARGDLNPYPLPEWNLNPSCLPISPRAHKKVRIAVYHTLPPAVYPFFHLLRKSAGSPGRKEPRALAFFAVPL